ncbi:hypothetical protein [Actinoallomurus sp. NPDC052274]|uniref:hypothetical protein n=1 Tax=Actinoallomurus sp. NPDC052274 TaxID=3155420 RepID=UPI0034402396
MSEVTDLLAELRNGSMSLEQVADRFRQRQWPSRKTSTPDGSANTFAVEEQDPEPLMEGSFDEVYVAYMRHELTDEQYEVLARAAAESQGS